MAKNNTINKKRLLNNFIEILKIESPSFNEKEIAGYLKNKLEKLGLKVFIDGCGEIIGSNTGNMIAKYRPDGLSGRYTIFLGAHMDTVAIKSGIVPIIKDGIIINSKSDTILGGDDKVAIAAILEAFETIIENNISVPGIDLIFTIAEEEGVLGIKHLDTKLIDADFGFVFDSEGDIGTITRQAPYQDSIYANFKGKAAHAGIEPEKGINSIIAAAKAIIKINSGRIDTETTCNVGKIEGGTARNIVPENTNLEIEARSLSRVKLQKTTDKIIKSLENSSNRFKTELNYKVIREYDGFVINDDEIPMVIAKKALENMGIEPKLVSTGGGSDINILNAAGKRAVNLSAGMENVHTSNEYVKISQLEKLAELVLEICFCSMEEYHR